MKSKHFRFHPEARQDLRNAIEWYRNRSPNVGAELRIAVSRMIRNIAQSPERWPKYLHRTRRCVLHRFPFSIIYLDDPDVVTIVAVAHSKRRPGYWRQRL